MNLESVLASIKAYRARQMLFLRCAAVVGSPQQRLLFWMPTSTIAITVLTIVAVASDKITATEAIPGLVTALGM